MVDFPASYVSLLSNVQWSTSPPKKNVTTTGNLDFLQPPPRFPPPGFLASPRRTGRDRKRVKKSSFRNFRGKNETGNIQGPGWWLNPTHLKHITRVFMEVGN